MKIALICSLLMLMCALCSAAPLGDGAFNTISISADEASEDEQPGILHLNGHFLMQSENWQIMSERAVVYGTPDRPDRVYIEGSPARFLIKREDVARGSTVEASALVVEYLRDSDRLVLSGNAVLMLEDEIIRSSNIEYDIGANRYRAGGADGVLIEVSPVD